MQQVFLPHRIQQEEDFPQRRQMNLHKYDKMKSINSIDDLDSILSGDYSHGEMWNEFYIDEVRKILANLSASEWDMLHKMWELKPAEWQAYLADAIESTHPAQLKMIETMLESGFTGDGNVFLVEELYGNEDYIPTKKIADNLVFFLQPGYVNESDKLYYEDLIRRYNSQ